MKRYRISSDGVEEIIDAHDRSEAEDMASDWIKDGSWDGKFMVDVTIQEVDDLQEDIGDSWCISVEVGDDPEPPDCREDYDHKWDSPVEVVGGIDENPGVWSTGGTTIVTKVVCRHCGVYKKETAYGSQRNPGQCDTVEYLDPDEASLAYVESRAELLEFLTGPGDDGKLTVGLKYDVDNLRVIGWGWDGPSEMLWTEPGVRNPGMDGYDAWAYFAADGRYLGPDEHGVEPLFRRVVAE